MTEDEARTKWCPMVRISIEGHGSYNQYSDGDIPEMCNCIASNCMMWREIRKQDSSTGYWNTVGGYCGLADRNR